MNREDLKELMPILEAYADGKTIQYCNVYPKDGVLFKWIDDMDFNPFAEPELHYRVKPEPPREFWAVTPGDAAIVGFFLSEEEVESGKFSNVVKLREVVE